MKKVLFLLLATVLSLTQMRAQDVTTVTIGSGTATSSSGPVPGFFGNHRSIQLFTADEFELPNFTIDSIAVQVGSVTSHSSPRAIRIYMKDVDDATVASSQVINDLTTDATLVYSSTNFACTPNQWRIITLDTPFEHSSSSNLMIIYEGEGCSSSGSCSVYLYYTAGTNKAWTKCWDTSTPSLTTPVSATNTYRANHRFYVSNVEGEFCYPVYDLAVTNITAESVDLTWTANENSTTFAVEYRMQGEEEWTLADNSIASTEYTLTGLTSLTHYEAKVYSVCDDGNSVARIITFYTGASDDQYVSIPYENDFNEGTTPELWTIVNAANNGWYFGTAVNREQDDQGEQLDGGALYVSYDNGVTNTYNIDSTSNSYAYTLVNLQQGSHYGVKFDFRGVGESTCDYVRVFLLPLDYNLSTSSYPSTGAISPIINQTATWQNVELAIPDSYVGSPYKLVFLWHNDGSVGHMPAGAIDNLNIIATGCAQVSDIAATFSDEGGSVAAEVTMTDENDGATYLLEYRAVGEETWTSETATSPISLSGLDYATTYQMRAKAVCSGSEEAMFSDVFSFVTPCAPYVAVPWTEGFETSPWAAATIEGGRTAPLCWINISGKSSSSSYIWKTSSTSFDGARSAYMDGYYSSSSTSESYRNSDWLITPVLELSGNEVLNFYSKKGSSSYSPELRIYAFDASSSDVSSPADTALFVAIDSISNLTTDYLEYQVDLSEFSGQYRLAFVRNRTFAHGSVYLDNVSVKPAPVCDRVTGLATTNVTDTEISLAWDEVEGATGYRIYYRQSSTTEWTTVDVTEASLTLTDLSPITKYIFNATVLCSDGQETGFMFGPALTVTTPCGVYQPPFSENFSSFSSVTSTSTGCWRLARGYYPGMLTGDSTLVYGSSSWSSSSNNAVLDGTVHAKMNIYRTSSTGSQKYEWLITPNIDLGDGSTVYDLKFDLAFARYSSSNDANNPVGCVGQRFMVLVSTNGGSTWNAHDELTWDSTSEDQTTNRLDLVPALGSRVAVNVTELGYTGPVMFAFYAEQTQYVPGQDNDLHLDNVMVMEHSDCPDMVAIDGEPTGAESIALTWDNTGNTTEDWTLAYVEGTTIDVEDDNVQTVTVPRDAELPYILEGLTAGGIYTFTIQYACGGAWANPTTDTLPANPGVVPYLCDFTDAEENASWVLTNGTCTNKWFIGTPTSATDENGGRLFVTNDNGASASYSHSYTTIFAERNIAFGDYALYKIEFDWACHGESSNDFIKVALRPMNETLTANTSSYINPSWTSSSTIQEGFTYPDGQAKFNLDSTISRGTIIIDGSNYRNTVQKLVFAWRNDNSVGRRPAEIFNVSVTGTNCVAPSDFGLAEDGRQTNSLTIDLTAEYGDSWELQYRPNGSEEEWESIFTTSLEGILVDNLLSGTMYEFRARTFCGDDTSFFSDIAYASTTCESITVTDDMPFVCGFEEESWWRGGLTNCTYGAPICWINIDGGSTSYNWRRSSGSSYAYSGTYGLNMSNSTSASAGAISDWFITPVFDLAGTETLSFVVRTSSAAETLEVMYYSIDENEDLATAADTANFELLETLNLAANTDWTSVDIPLSELAGSYRLAFHSAATGSYIKIDDFTVSINSCSRPDASGITIVGLTATSASIEFEDETNSAWILYYKAAGEEEYTSVPTTSTTVDLTDLTPATNYTFYLVGDCGGSESAPTTVITFMTPCASITELPWTEGFDSSPLSSPCWEQKKGLLPASGVVQTSSLTSAGNWSYSTGVSIAGQTSNRMRNNVYSTSKNDWLMSPIFTFEEGTTYSISFDLAVTRYATPSSAPAAAPDDRFAVLVSTDGGLTWDVSNALIFANGDADTEHNYADLTNVPVRYMHRLVDENGDPLTGEVRFAFYGESTISNGDNDLFIDNITIEQWDPCQIPNNLNVSPSATTADVTFSGNGMTDWQYSLVEGSDEDADFDAGTIIDFSEDDLPLVVDNLEMSTTYTLAIRSACEGGTFSAWSEPVTFTTAAAVPYTCDFEQSGTNGWAIDNGTFTNKWFVGTPTGQTSRVLYVSGDANGTTATYAHSASCAVAERVIQTGESDSLTISFDLTIGGESSYDYLKVYWVPADTNFVLTTSATPYFGDKTYATNVIFNNASTSSYRFVNLLTGTQTLTTTIVNQPNTVKKLVFVWRNDGGGGNGNGAIIDNISIQEVYEGEQPEPCDAPTDLAVSAITQTGATVTWNGSASSYEVRLNGGTAETVTTTTKTYTDLTAATSYTVEVRSLCESGNSAWVSTTFTTLEGEVVVTPPTVATLAATNVTHNGATLNGTITAGTETITAQGFRYKTSAAADWTEVSATGTTISATLTTLTAETAYDFKAFATTASGTVEGTVMTFTTSAAPIEVIAPTVTTLAATNVTHDAATLNGTITAGNETITAQGFRYKTAAAADWTTVNATGTTITATLTDLTAETAYDFKAFATTASGTVEGDVMTFTTEAAPIEVIAPTVTTMAATSVTSDGATLNGTIVAGNEEITAQGFMYKQDGAADWTTVAAAGENIAHTLTGLASATTYRFKAFATTASGTVEGAEMSFTTLAGLADIESAAISATIYPNPASERATLSIDGLTETAQIVLTDVQGRVILTDSLNAGAKTYELNVRSLSSGVYYVRVIAGSTIATKKLIVE